MRRLGRVLAGSVGFSLLVAVAGTLQGQSNVLDLRFLEVDSDGDRTYHNAIFSHGFGDSRFSFEAFWLFLPQVDSYDELGVGLGFRLFERGDVSVSLLGYLATAPDDDYLEPAVLAMDTGGRLTWSLLVLRYLPLGESGIDQWLVDPFEVQVKVKGPVSVGLSAYLYRPSAGDWLRKLGPKMSVSDKWGATEIAVRDVNLGGKSEVQLRRLFFF